MNIMLGMQDIQQTEIDHQVDPAHRSNAFGRKENITLFAKRSSTEYLSGIHFAPVRLQPSVLGFSSRVASPQRVRGTYHELLVTGHTSDEHKKFAKETVAKSGSFPRRLASELADRPPGLPACLLTAA